MNNNKLWSAMAGGGREAAQRRVDFVNEYVANLRAALGVAVSTLKQSRDEAEGMSPDQPSEAEGLRDFVYDTHVAALTQIEKLTSGDSAPDSKSISVITEVANERKRQDEKWGVQNHPDGTTGIIPPPNKRVNNAAQAKRQCEEAAKNGSVTWFHILQEEYFEAVMEVDEQRLREELIQVSAVAVAWIECIDRRKASGDSAQKALCGGETPPSPGVDNDGDWYCPQCAAYLCSSRVTNSETCDTCGSPVQWHTAKQRDHIAELKAEIERLRMEIQLQNDARVHNVRFTKKLQQRAKQSEQNLKVALEKVAELEAENAGWRDDVERLVERVGEVEQERDEALASLARVKHLAEARGGADPGLAWTVDKSNTVGKPEAPLCAQFDEAMEQLAAKDAEIEKLRTQLQRVVHRTDPHTAPKILAENDQLKAEVERLSSIVADCGGIGRLGSCDRDDLRQQLTEARELLRECIATIPCECGGAGACSGCQRSDRIAKALDKTKGWE